MLGTTINIALPRRVSVYSMLFGMAAVAVLVASTVFVARSVVRTMTLNSRLTGVERFASMIKIATLKESPNALQETVERVANENSLAHCALVGRDGVFLAHSKISQRDKTFQTPTGASIRWGDLQGVRYESDGVTLSEFHMPLNRGEETIGSLRFAVEEPGWGVVLRAATNYVAWSAVGGIALVVLGGYVVRRQLHDVADIESQLSVAAVAPTISDLGLRNASGGTPSAMGWNRVVEWLRNADQSTGLGQRLTEAMGSLRREKSNDILNSLTDGLAVTNNAGQVTFANTAMSSLLLGDADGASLNDKTIIEFLHLPEAETEHRLVDRRFENRNVVFELTREAPDGETQYWRVARHPLRTPDRNNPSAGHVWNIRDITQQKLAEKMRDQFLDSATHELRTPLANIRAYAETLACADVMDVESQKQFCNTINSEATRLARFIDDLLSISSMEVGSLSLNITDVDIERLLNEAIEKIKPQIVQKGMTLNAVLPEKFPKLRLDKDKIIVALVNLLGNAIKYTPAGGHVTLRVKVEDNFLVDIEDTGMGISEEELPKVFDKFFRSDDSRVQEITGTGLGLSMSQEVIRLHGGELSVQSVLDKGSTFTISLPLAKRSG